MILFATEKSVTRAFVATFIWALRWTFPATPVKREVEYIAEELDSLKLALRESLHRPAEGLWTLEPGHYTSNEYYDLEIEHIFKKEWICVGHILEVKQPGDLFTVELVGEPMMIVRGADD